MSEKDSRITGEKFELDYLEIKNKLLTLENKLNQRLKFIKKQCPTLIVYLTENEFDQCTLNYIQHIETFSVEDKISIIKQFEELNKDKHGKQLKLDL